MLHLGWRNVLIESNSTIKLCHHMSFVHIPILWVIRSDGDGRWLPGHWPGYGHGMPVRQNPSLTAISARVVTDCRVLCTIPVVPWYAHLDLLLVKDVLLAHTWVTFFVLILSNSIWILIYTHSLPQVKTFRSVAYYESWRVMAKPLETPLAF